MQWRFWFTFFVACFWLGQTHGALAQPLSPVAEPVSSPSITANALEGLTVHSADERFSLHLGALLQFRAQALTSTANSDVGFQTRMVRPQLRGHIWMPWVRYFVQPELAGNNARLLDLEIEAQPLDEIGVRAGQFLTPFSRSFLTPVPKLQFPDFSVANDFFRADRDTGCQVFGHPHQGLWEYAVGAFNGNGIDQNGNEDDQLLWMARIAVHPLGAVALDETPVLVGPQPLLLSFGLNGYRGQRHKSELRVDDATGTLANVSLGQEHNYTVGIDIAARYGLWSAQTEGYMRWNTPLSGAQERAWGGYLQTSQMVIWPYLELAGRFNLVQPNVSAGASPLRSFEALITYYVLGNHLKLQARYTSLYNPTSIASVPQGSNIHIATLQTQLSF